MSGLAEVRAVRVGVGVAVAGAVVAGATDYWLAEVRDGPREQRGTAHTGPSTVSIEGDDGT